MNLSKILEILEKTQKRADELVIELADKDTSELSKLMKEKSDYMGANPLVGDVWEATAVFKACGKILEGRRKTMSTEKTERGFNLWKPIINDRCESVSFQESSAVGLNTWIVLDTVDTKEEEYKLPNGNYPLNVASEKGRSIGQTMEARKKAEEEGVEYTHITMHLDINDLLALQKSIDAVVKYHMEERSTWYNDTS